MKRHQSKASKTTVNGATSSNANGFVPKPIKFISTCIKTVSSGVRSATASISPDSDDRKDQVLWACFDRLETGPTFKNVLLLGYVNGFQVLDVEDASNVTELVSRRDDPCTFMQIQPIPTKSKDTKGLAASHLLLLIVACDEAKGSDVMLRSDGCTETEMGTFINSGSNVRFYSMRSHTYVHVLRFRSAVYMVRCSPHIVAVGLASQIYCFDALTLENKFSVLTYPIPQPGGQGINGINIGHGPMDVGSRWLAFAPNKPIITATGRLSPQSPKRSPGVSPSTSPGNGSLVTQYAMESSKQLAVGLINLGDMGYKSLSKYCQELLPDSPSFPISSNTGWKVRRSKSSSEMDNAGMVVVKDFASNGIVSQFKAHCSPISALCFDPSGTLLVTASIHGNNINIFRIMPSCSQNRSETQSHNWTSSHVHLYKLHRGITSAIYCFDALTLENKFSVLTYPIPQPGGQGINGINIGHGPMDVGSRWLAFAPNKPIITATGRLSPQSPKRSPGVSPSTSPGNGSLVTQYAMESSKQLAVGLINLGDMGYKSLSKYCQELLPDSPSFPISSNTGWKVRRSKSSSEMDNAGMVVVKDFVSNGIVSQFKAHCSPISALCFDPSGTLLVTASIHGNNINIFRIMPSCSQNRSETQSHNWTSSHVHLYKLHRGITSAGIQHICFSHYSQWVTIVSSKGTCHIYLLSPFGGESSLKVQNSHVDGPTIALMLSLPWWHVPSYTKTQHSCPPPPSPVNISVVSRIRTGNSGWLNTFSNTASSAAGIASMMTPGAISAVFHSSVASGLKPNGSKAKALEHLLVYSPSGHLIQYEMVPAIVGERNETAPATGSLSMVHMQDDELRVKCEPVQWWDVCRRAEWPEKEQCIPRMTLRQNNSAGLGIDNSNLEDNDTNSGRKGPVKLQERSHLYLSNAEVQISSGRVPIWQRSEIHFFTMSLVGPDGLKFSEEFSRGEIEIETFPGDEVVTRLKDLLPVYHSQNVLSSRSDRGYGVGRCPNVLNKFLVDEKYAEDAYAFTNKPDSPKAVQKSEPTGHVHVFSTGCAHSGGEECEEKSSTSVSTYSTQGLAKRYNISAVTGNSAMDISPPQNNCLVNTPSCLTNTICTTKNPILKKVQLSHSVGTSEGSNISSNSSDFSMNLVDEGSIQESYEDELDFGQFFQDESHDMGEVVTDVDSSSSPHTKEKSEEDMDGDEMLGGVFDLTEEG